MLFLIASSKNTFTKLLTVLKTNLNFNDIMNNPDEFVSRAITTIFTLHLYYYVSVTDSMYNWSIITNNTHVFLPVFCEYKQSYNACLLRKLCHNITMKSNHF